MNLSSHKPHARVRRASAVKCQFLSKKLTHPTQPASKVSRALCRNDLTIQTEMEKELQSSRQALKREKAVGPTLIPSPIITKSAVIKII